MGKSQRMWKREQERRKKERQRRAKRKQLCVIIVLLAAIAAVIIIFGKGCGKTSISNNAVSSSENSAIVTPSAAPYRSSIDITDVNTSFFDNSVFIGNSVADTISLYGLLPDTDFYTSPILTVDNVYTTVTGFGTTAAADQLKSKKFNKIFICFGEREIAAGDISEFERGYGEFVQKVKTYQTNAQIYLISIPPSSKSSSENGLYGMSLNTISGFNKRIKNIAAEEKVFYVNSFSPLGGGSFLHEGVSADGINLNRDCCIELLKYITEKAYVPDDSSDDTDDNIFEEKAAEKEIRSTPKPTTVPEKATATPQPTVNVFKDSEIEKAGE